jgi:hypothetical protein
MNAADLIDQSEAPSAAGSEIQNQNSKITNPPTALDPNPSSSSSESQSSSSSSSSSSSFPAVPPSPPQAERLPETSSDQIQNQNSKIKNDPDPLHRKVAKLPRPLRELINSMLDDGLPARQIIANLEAVTDPPLPYPISEKNISDWRITGYRRHLLQQERLALVQANREGAGDLIANDELTALPEATLQIVANQYYEFLGDFSPETLRQKLTEDPLKYTRFLNVFARLVREIVHLRKFRDASAKPADARLKKLDPDRDLSENEFDLLVHNMDKVFKVARPRPPARASQAATPESHEDAPLSPKSSS